MLTTYSYYLSGLAVSSTIEFPELQECNDPKVHDVLIEVKDRQEFGELEEKAKPEVTRGNNSVVYAVPKVGYFKISNGDTIIVYPTLRVLNKVVRLYILGLAYAALMDQRGFLTLHSSVVAVNGSACLFIGEKGAGKSTTAALLIRRGHSLVADDVAAINTKGTPRVRLGARHLKLSRESLPIMEDALVGSFQAHPEVEKYVTLFNQNSACVEYKIETIYVLSEASRVSVEQMATQKAFQEVVRHSYISSTKMSTKERKIRHFKQCLSIARNVTVCKLSRPKDLSRSYMLVDVIEDRVAKVTKK